jgi:hypothetical protein
VNAHDLDHSLHEVGTVAGYGGHLHTVRERSAKKRKGTQCLRLRREDVGAAEARDEVYEGWLPSDTRVRWVVSGQLGLRKFLDRRGERRTAGLAIGASDQICHLSDNLGRDSALHVVQFRSQAGPVEIDVVLEVYQFTSDMMRTIVRTHPFAAASSLPTTSAFDQLEHP